MAGFEQDGKWPTNQVLRRGDGKKPNRPKKKRKEKFPRRSSGPLAASRACSVSSFLFVPDFFVVFFCFFFSCYLRVEVGFIHSVMTLTRGDGQNYLRFIARDGPPSSSSSTSSSSSSFLSLQNSVNSRRQNPVTDRHSVHTVRFRSSSRAVALAGFFFCFVFFSFFFKGGAAPRRFCVAFDFDLFDWLVGLFVCLFVFLIASIFSNSHQWNVDRPLGTDRRQQLTPIGAGVAHLGTHLAAAVAAPLPWTPGPPPPPARPVPPPSMASDSTHQFLFFCFGFFFVCYRVVP